MIDINPNNQKQQTIKESISISGIALHSGKEVEMKLVPAEIDEGVKFIRSDKKKDNVIQAIWPQKLPPGGLSTCRIQV